MAVDFKLTILLNKIFKNISLSILVQGVELKFLIIIFIDTIQKKPNFLCSVLKK